jgi:hypothetical protein
MKIKQVLENGDPKNKEIAYNFFVEEKGYSPEIAAGIVGNLMQESHSNLNTQALGFDGTGSYGVAQWLGPRKEKLKQVRPNDYSTLRGQLEFIDWELNNTEKRASRKLNKAKTAEEAALIFSKHYERPHRDYAANNKRVSYANNLLKNAGNATPSSTMVSGTGVAANSPQIEPESAPKTYQGQQSYAYDNKSANATYADITLGDEETPKTVEVTQNGLDEAQVRKMLDQERSDMENKFTKALQQSMPQQQRVEEQQYAQPQEDLYNYVDIENFAEGGKLPDEKSNYLDEILGIDRRPTPNKKTQNPFGAVNNKDIYEELALAKTSDRPKEEVNNKPISNPFPKMPEGVSALDYNNFIPKDDFTSKLGIERVQNKLIAAGYDLGTTGADGSNGPKTKAAYESYVKEGRAKGKNYFGEVKQGFDPFEFGSTGDESKREEFGTKTEIEKTQRDLIAAGYDLGKYGKNKDGVDGNAGLKTRAAKKDYDSIASRFITLDSDTDIIEYQKNLQSQGSFQGINASSSNDAYRTAEGKDPFMLNPKNSCDTKFCTAYVGEQIEAAIGDGEDGKTGGRSSIDAYGDAWTYNERILNKGGTEIFSVFEDKKPKIEGGSAGVEDYIKNRISSNDKVNYNDLQAGDTLNLFYPGSTFADQAYKEGTKYFTSHAGMVKKNSKGELFVEHNVGGKVYKSPLQDFIDGKAKNAAGKTMAITAAVRPNYKDLRQGNKDLVNNDNVTNKNSSLYGYNHSVFTETLKSNKKELEKDLNITGSEFDGLSRAMRSIAFKESDYGENSNNYSEARNIAGNIKEFLGVGEKSRGMTSLKDKKNLPENLRKKYVKGKGENLNNPAESAIPSFYALGARYKYLKDLNVVKKLGMKQEDITKLAMLAWNEDVSVVAKSMEKYKTYDSVMKAYRGENGRHDYDLTLVAYQDYLK